MFCASEFGGDLLAEHLGLREGGRHQYSSPVRARTNARRPACTNAAPDGGECTIWFKDRHGWTWRAHLA
jgi:hypothetical protein